MIAHRKYSTPIQVSNVDNRRLHSQRISSLLQPRCPELLHSVPSRRRRGCPTRPRCASSQPTPPQLCIRLFRIVVSEFCTAGRTDFKGGTPLGVVLKLSEIGKAADRTSVRHVCGKYSRRDVVSAQFCSCFHNRRSASIKSPHKPHSRRTPSSVVVPMANSSSTSAKISNCESDRATT